MAKALPVIVAVFAAFFVSAATSDASYCREVLRGRHYYESHDVFPEFVNATVRRVTVIFDDDTAAYECDCSAEPYPGCMSSWNKLWGSGRCGFAHPHHQDSDRFVWRRQMQADGVTPGNVIELAAYSYDSGVKPYSPPNPNLLQPFTATLTPGVPYDLVLDVSDPAASVFSLSDTYETFTETKTVAHDNACAKAAEGYRLSLYFGGQCRAPSTVTVCYVHEDPPEERYPGYASSPIATTAYTGPPGR